MTGRAVAVTGGTGFIGRRLVARLLADGVSVRMLARRPDTVPAADGLTVVPGDIRDADAVARLVHGTTEVQHLAGYARAWAGDPGVYHAVNAGGTAHVLSASRSAGVRTVVIVSTALVSDGPRPMLTSYQTSKAQAEKLARDAAAAGQRAVIVRPTRVYGPGPLNQANSVTRAIELYRRGILRVRLDDDDAVANYVHVDDVVDGMRRAAGHGAAGATYALGDTNVTFAAFLDAVGRAIGRVRRTVVLPGLAARGVAGVCEGLARFGIEPLITRDWLELLQVDWPVSSRAAADELGYAPRGLAAGLEQTVAWLRDGRPMDAAA